MIGPAITLSVLEPRLTLNVEEGYILERGVASTLPNE